MAKLTAKQRSLANLKPFKPGQSGNPNGTPKVHAQLKRHIDKYLSKTPAQLKKLNKDKLKAAELVALRLVMDAIGGKWQQTKELLERYEGKVADKVERIEPEQVDTEKVKATLRLIHGNTG